MRRVLRVVMTVIPVAALAACTSPMAPEAAAPKCLAGKVPYATCVNGDYINPQGDYINPQGDYINPNGNRVLKSE
jgi:hypothetical protein